MVDTPDVNTSDEIARVAANDVKHMFRRSGLHEIVRLAKEVAAEKSSSPRPERPTSR